MISIGVLLYNLAIVAGCGYVVFGLGHSGWWFVVAILLTRSSKDCDCED